MEQIVVPTEERVITEVNRSEDGWNVKAENAAGHSMSYWLAGDFIPRLGDCFRLIGGIGGHQIQQLAINGQVVLDR